ncbi:toxin YdaT family protein [Serratia fonticola]|uniref:toxin YdaT family protein n=1 Tax=Serratia fonticola TaxID=47917 RepID=UPI003AAD6EF1|nr:hypothetical protein [Serratia fonticola]HBE9088486.1 hypothetical protein [Serratia fonticola]
MSFANAIRASGRRVISENQYKPSRRDHFKHKTLYEAVREWESTLTGQAQEDITKLVAKEWHRRGGRGLTINKLNLFRYLKNETGSPKYTRYVLQLATVIADVMPIEIARKYGLKQGKTKFELVADAIKECADAKQAALLVAPLRELEKEIREGIESLVRLAPPDRWAAVMTSAAAVFSGCF